MKDQINIFFCKNHPMMISDVYNSNIDHWCNLMNEHINQFNDYSTITNLWPYEISLLCSGYKMIKWCKLNAYDPIFRSYNNGGKNINIGFGYGKINFYVMIDFEYYYMPLNCNDALIKIGCQP